jgi:SAM-dependent methyltransferase
VVAAVGSLGLAALWRQRVGQLGSIGAVDGPVDEPATDSWAWLTAPGIEPDEATTRTAVRYAEAEGLDVVDLVPGDLPTDRVLELLRYYSPDYRTAPFAAGITARQAILVRRSVLERAGMTPSSELDEVQFLRAAAELKRFCPTSTDVAVAAGLRATDEDPGRRMGYLTAKWNKAARLGVGVPLVGYLVLAAGLVLSPVWGLIALVSWCLQPLVALAGTTFSPPDLVAHSAGRWFSGPRDLLRVARGRWRPTPAELGLPDPEVLREEYAAALARGTAPFFEDHRDDCPICGSRQLTVRLEVPDLMQGKPGTFVLEECHRCGLVFQNPRLSIEGLDFYYRDFYDGLMGQATGDIFGADDRTYEARAAMVRGRATPKNWLDVGTGHGHFCLVAKRVWPDTVVEVAERAGWVTTGYRGQLVELADRLAGTYDVVSMHHYLEHTREPLEELDAAVRVLAPDGHLVIELPDPECGFEQRVLGKYWAPWFQPQHQHFLPVSRLSEELERRGMEVLEVQRGPAYMPGAFTGAAGLLLSRLAPATDLPWRPRAGTMDRARRTAVIVLGAPVVALAFAVDRLVTPVERRAAVTNTYRLVARRT